MSESNVTTRVHEFVAGMKVIPPAHKFEYPVQILDLVNLDDYARHFAVNSMLVPLAFSAVSQMNFKLNIQNRALQTAAFFDAGSTDAFNEIRQEETKGKDADEHTEEIGFQTLERANPSSMYLYMRLGKEQAVNAYQLYGGRYMPFDIPSAVDFLVGMEPKAKAESTLKKETSAFLKKELAHLGVDPEELEGEKTAVVEAIDTRNKETLAGNRDKIIEGMAEFKTCQETNEELWKQIPLATQYKCMIKVYISLKKSLARKVARIEMNPTADNAAQMDNEKNPVAMAMRALLEDMHAVYKANKQLFELMQERDASLPELPPMLSAEQLTAKYG